MREIKFRAWDTSEKTMFYDAQATYDYRCTGKGCFEESFQDVIGSDQYVVMQYIGIKDKDGTEIYESDIVKLDSGHQFALKGTGVVRWDDVMCAFGVKEIEPYVLSLVKCNVIGNIYENTELLEA